MNCRLAAASICLLLPLCAQEAPHVHTSRDGSQLLKLPKEDDAFGFVVFGDRTGGPPDGIKTLAQAVADTNLLDPDLVLTVGDLVNGYNERAAWQAQAKEYKDTCGKLRMPWFPVAGNHDIYWRGADKPPGEHERDFETTFGPLWYAFEHKRCWFVVLYSDEGDPKTGAKDFNDADCQRMSDAQFEWLQATLGKAKGARHVFVFLHHPRWIAARYPGSDWERVHTLLAKNGNVTAVFAGHIHRMRFDGVRDGIQYFTVASVGATLPFDAPQPGYLHEFHVVTVRPGGIQVAAIPVGTVMDPKTITGEVSDDAELLHDTLRPQNMRGIAFGEHGAVDGLLQMEFTNPAHRPIELTILPSLDDGWVWSPDHQHATIAPGASATLALAARRPPTPDRGPLLPQFELRIDYLGQGLRFSLPSQTVEVPLDPPAGLRAAAAADGALRLRARGDCAAVDSARLRLPDGPLTIEGWFCPDAIDDHRALLAKTEQSEFGMFCNDGRLEFSVFVAGKYAIAASDAPVLATGRWQHIAGVFDGQELRAYVDGRLVARAAGQGARKTNAFPFYVGADPNAHGEPVAFFQGAIDEVRVSSTARYRGERFAPTARFAADADTALLLHCDADAGSWLCDDSPQHAHARRRGHAACAPR
jgi:predicted phosphodiesterase